jgi:hypothetical protein
MPKDHWLRNKKPKRIKRERKIKPCDIEEESRAFELARQQQSSKHRKPNKTTRPDPVPWVRPDYDDYPPVTTYSVYRDYDPVFYGRQSGTRHPVTAEQTQKG